MRNSCFMLLATITCILVSANAIAGVKVALTPSFFTDYLQYHLPLILERFQSNQLPNITKGDATISNITIKKMYFPTESMNLTFNEGNISLMTHQFGFSVDFDFKYKIVGYIPFSAHFGGSSNQSSLSIDFTFKSPDRYAQIRIDSLKVTIDNLTLHNSQGESAYIRTKMFHSIVESILSRLLTSYMKETIQNKINDEIAKLSGLVTIPKMPIIINYKFAQPPGLNPGHFIAYINGTSYYRNAEFALPPFSQRIDYPEYNASSSSNIQVFMSEFFLNSATYSLWKSNLMNFTVTNKMISSIPMLKLNIATLKQFVPSVSALYKNDRTELVMNIEANSAPLITLQENDVKINVDTILNFYAIEGENLSKVVSLVSTLEMHAIATVSNWTVKPMVSSAKFGPFSIVGAQEGSYDPAVLQNGLNLILTISLQAMRLIKPMFPLPEIPTFNLSSLTFVVHDGYIQIEARPQYKIVQKDEKEKENVVKAF